MKTLTDYRPDDLIPATEMSNLFPGTTDQTWNALRHKGGGPAYVAVMRRIYYRRRDIDAWLEANRMVRTDTPAAPSNIDPVTGRARARVHTAKRR